MLYYLLMVTDSRRNYWPESVVKVTEYKDAKIAESAARSINRVLPNNQYALVFDQKTAEAVLAIAAQRGQLS